MAIKKIKVKGTTVPKSKVRKKIINSPIDATPHTIRSRRDAAREKAEVELKKMDSVLTLIPGITKIVTRKPNQKPTKADLTEMKERNLRAQYIKTKDLDKVLNFAEKIGSIKPDTTNIPYDTSPTWTGNGKENTSFLITDQDGKNEETFASIEAAISKYPPRIEDIQIKGQIKQQPILRLPKQWTSQNTDLVAAYNEQSQSQPQQHKTGITFLSQLIGDVSHLPKLVDGLTKTITGKDSVAEYAASVFPNYTDLTEKLPLNYINDLAFRTMILIHEKEFGLWYTGYKSGAHDPRLVK